MRLDAPTSNDDAAKPAPLVFLSKRQVLAKVPVTAPTLWAWCRDPAKNFPKPRALARSEPNGVDRGGS
jgi:hypothetical protein